MTNLVLLLQRQVAEGASGDGGSGNTAASNGAHDELSAKVDALHGRIFGLQDHAPKIAEFEAQLAQLRSDLEKATTAASEAPPLPPPMLTGPDSETLDRIAAVQQRVNDLDQIRHRLGEIDDLKQRLGELDHLHQRVAGVETQFAEQPVGADEDIRLQIQEIGERLRVREELQGQVGQLAERVSVSDAEARAVREHMAMLDQRLTNVSTELANQLSELGSDIDGLGQRLPEGAETAVNDEVVDALRGGQVKLANEQARYEIAFRQDLATLAEQVRQGRDDGSEGDAG
jgi:DNA repair exonuclease SbcCD ATPase subunit